MRIRASSLAIASAMVATALVAGATLAPGREFGGIYAPIVLPAAAIVYVAMGGVHNFGGGPAVYAPVFVLSVVLWYFLIEAVRRWWPRRQPSL